MANKLKGYESVDVDGKSYLFKADFSFLAELKDEANIDPMAIFAAFTSGEGDPLLVRAVLVSSIVSIDNVELTDSERRERIEQMITEFGLQESWILAQHMLSYAMIGSVKKFRLETLEKVTEALGFSSYTNSKSRLSLWALRVLIFGGFACISIRLYELLIWLSTG